MLMVVLDQVSTRGASNTLRLACEDLEVPPPPTAPSSRRVPFLAPRIANLPPLIAPWCPLLYRVLANAHPGARPNRARAALRRRETLRRSQAQGWSLAGRVPWCLGDSGTRTLTQRPERGPISAVLTVCSRGRRRDLAVHTSMHLGSFVYFQGSFVYFSTLKVFDGRMTRAIKADDRASPGACRCRRNFLFFIGSRDAGNALVPSTSYGFRTGRVCAR